MEAQARGAKRPRLARRWDVPYQGKGGQERTILLALLVALLFVAMGFALHLLWVVAAIVLLVWLVGSGLGRGESAGRHHFYRW